MKIDLTKNFVKYVGSKRKAISLVNTLAEKDGDRVTSYSTSMSGRYINYVEGLQKNFKWTYMGSSKKLSVFYIDGREKPVEKEPKNTYFVIWVEGLSSFYGEKIKKFGTDGIEYTLKMTEAMRVLPKDVPAMREKLRELGVAEWVIESGNTFAKTFYAPKGTLFNF